MTTLGGIELALRHPRPAEGLAHRAFQHTFRAGVNGWIVVVGDVRGTRDHLEETAEFVVSEVHAALGREGFPSTALSGLNRLLADRTARTRIPHTCALIVAHLELDICGVRATLANAGCSRPIVVRNAGWVDIRGHGSRPLGAADVAPTVNRVGLGPGDAMVLCSGGIARTCGGHGTVFGERVLPDALLNALGKSAEEVAECVLNAQTEHRGDRTPDDAVVLVLRVPESVRSEGAKWVANSTGVPVDQLVLPRYPLRAELATAGAVPPREVLVRLAPEPPSIPALRRLLRRLVRSWRLDAVAEGNIELLATEMATNVFSHTASPVTVIVRYTGPVIRIEIGDGERQLPRKKRVHFDDLSGHRLALVDALASRWGVGEGSAGTRMWFEIATTG